MARRGAKVAELIGVLVELGTRNLVEQCELPELQAREAMRQIAHALARNYGGSSMCVPKDSWFGLNERDVEICRRLTRGNANQLAREFGLSAHQVYAINRHVRARRAGGAV